MTTLTARRAAWTACFALLLVAALSTTGCTSRRRPADQPKPAAAPATAAAAKPAPGATDFSFDRGGAAPATAGFDDEAGRQALAPRAPRPEELGAEPASAPRPPEDAPEFISDALGLRGEGQPPAAPAADEGGLEAVGVPEAPEAPEEPAAPERFELPSRPALPRGSLEDMHQASELPAGGPDDGLETPEAPAPAAPAAAAYTGAGTDYVVQRGDTLWGLARKFGVSASAIKAANPNLLNADHIEVGKALTIPSR